MKFHFRGTILLIFAMVVAVPAMAQFELPRPSPLGKVDQRVGMTDIQLEFYRPGVKNRVIWGELVPYGEVWRTGANNASTISFSTDVRINGQALAAGRYAIHTIPGETEWTIMFNSDWDKTGTAYDAEKDALRIHVTPSVTAEPMERMTFEIPTLHDGGAIIQLRWEHLIVPFSVEVDVVNDAMKAIDAELPKADRWQTFYQAANFAFENDLRLSDAETWVARSVAMEESFFNLGLQARILAKNGKEKEALAVAQKAIRIGKEQNRDVSELEEFVKGL